MPVQVNSPVCELRTESRFVSRFAGRRVHFIGIGGCGMSGLARMLIDSGAIVTGSELQPNEQTFELSARGARISRDQSGEFLSRDIDIVVRTAAVKDTNIEYLGARAMGLKTVKYAALLGQVMEERLGVAVAGTHGKSTTTAMIAWAMLECGADPSFVVGGTVPQLGGGSRSGAGKAFVAEACEFDRSFHNLRPRIAIITNIEEDHLDCYRNLEEIIASFRHFAGLVPADGTIIANALDTNVDLALADISCPIERAGLVEGYPWSTRIIGKERGCYRGEVFHKGTAVAILRMSVAGEHNLLNATMALAACHACGVDVVPAAAALGTFAGVGRRMEELGTVNGAAVVDDYAHHPTEIRATLKAAREKYRPRRLICIFQPHQHSRTRFLLEDFAASFEQADEVIVPDIYFVRDSEAEMHAVSADDLVRRIATNGGRASHVKDFDEIVEQMRHAAGEGDLVMTMGAGNVCEIGRKLVA